MIKEYKTVTKALLFMYLINTLTIIYFMTSQNNYLGYLSKISLLALIFILGLVISVTPVFSEISTMSHTSEASLEPEWSAAGALMEYTVTITNDGPDTVDEVRIYKNGNYENFSCDEKSGWELYYIGALDACFYVHNPDNIPSGENETFNFSAKTSVNPKDTCQLKWKFETRDDKDYWQYIYDTTSIDSNPPNITKSVGTPQSGPCPPGDNQECWVTQDTMITVQVTDDYLDTECDSGIDYCTYSIYLDDNPNPIYNHTFNPVDPEMNIGWTLNFNEDSKHTLKIYCIDMAGNNVTDIEVFRVDNTPPETNKTYGLPHYPTGINDVNKTNYPHWITTHTPVTLTAVDPDPTNKSCNIDNVTTYYRNYGPFQQVPNKYCENYNACMNWTPNGEGCGWTVYNGSFYEEEESCHIIEYYSEDELGNKEPVKWQCVYVEDTPPEKEKVIGEPKLECSSINGSDCWWVRDHVTEINLSCGDPTPHPVGHEEVCYKISYDMAPWWLTEQYCNLSGGIIEGDWCCADVANVPYTIIFREDSLHNLEYYCRDALGNRNEETDLGYFRVDSQAPIINKTIEGPQIGDCPPRLGTNDTCWIKDWTEGSNGTTIHVEAYDNNTYENCTVGGVTCDWYYYLDGNYEIPGGANVTSPFDIKFYEDTVHELHIVCRDALGNEVEDVETFYLDSQPPETVKSYGEPQVVEPNCLANCESQYPGDAEGVEKCVHEQCTIWINSNTPITLNATDYPDAPCAVGVNKTYWRNTLVEDEYCWNVYDCQYAKGNGTWNEYLAPFYEPDYSCHLIEYYSEDSLGNVENVKKQCVFVDNLAPNGTKTVGEPKLECSSINGSDCWWVRDHVTPVTLDCSDLGAHPVEQETVCYRVSYDYVYNATSGTYDWGYITGDYCSKFGGKMEGDWCCAYVGDESYTLNFTEDSVHDLEFYCRDKLNNTEETTDLEYFKVDSVAPNTTKTYLGPYYVDENGSEYIDNVSRIELNATDGGEICHVDGVKTYYLYTLVDDSMCRGQCSKMHSYGEINNNYTEPFGIPEESCHLIEYYSEDALGNLEDIQYQCVFADHTPPKTCESYSEPFYEEGDECECYGNNCTKWITNETNITLIAKDLGDHPSGVNRTYYKDIYLENEKDWHYCYNNCTAWNEDVRFGLPTAPEPYNPSSRYVHSGLNESCHIIEYHSVDNVNKTEEIQWQCVFVDNTPPTPNKTIGKPREVWIPRNINDSEYDGDTSHFYPEANELCWVLPEEECKNASSDVCLECWKVTRDSPITMDCIDPEPHPVNHEKVCFTVGVDAKDETERYCKEYEGSYNESGDGFCCLDGIIENFKFLERTEHELEYYCVDALGNKGELDIEKFKVTGDSFNIKLNHKWNLISIPYVLLDNNITKVFEDIAEDVESVWTYDAATNLWSVYRPNEEGTSTLKEMNPGEGYWVMVYNDTNLTIGGDLYNPIITPPSKELKTGWNLIGYYGLNDDVKDYEGPLGMGERAYCALYSLRDGDPNMFSVMLPVKWDNLVTYWEPLGEEFIERGVCDKMDSGAGYWIHMGEDDSYARSSMCRLTPVLNNFVDYLCEP